MAKWIIGILILIAAGGALWWSGWLSTFVPSQGPTTTPQTTTQQSTPQNGMSANNDNSDAALGQDSAAIDAQIQALTQDSAAVDSSLNDKPVQQSY